MDHEERLAAIHKLGRDYAFLAGRLLGFYAQLQALRETGDTQGKAFAEVVYQIMCVNAERRELDAQLERLGAAAAIVQETKRRDVVPDNFWELSYNESHIRDSRGRSSRRRRERGQ